jgi:serine/threonine protein kinase
MLDLKMPRSASPRIGQYVLTRQLAPGILGERWLALHELDHSSHVVHRPVAGRDRFEQRKFLAVLGSLTSVSNAHIIEIEEHGLDSRGQPWVVTPFTGDASGIITLEGHLRAKGGFLRPGEAREAIVQLLQASSDAHAAGVAHGPLTMNQVLVDRRGSLLIELYGLGLALSQGYDALTSDQSQIDEVESILRIGYRLVTGLLPEDPIIPACRVVSDLDPAWDDWFDTGLYSGAGFKSAAHALSALVDRGTFEPLARGRMGVRSVLRRLLFVGA